MVALSSVATAHAGILVGDPPTNGNTFPFVNNSASNTRYQQVYANSSFSGVTEINGLRFFASLFPSSTFAEADYLFTLSTSNFAVDNLDTINLNANPGGDASVFASVHLSGATTPAFTIAAGTGGGSSFLYDPNQGDLLVDIVRSNVIGGGSGGIDHNIASGGVFSRAHNFGTGFIGRGLVTEFLTTQVQPIPEPSGLAVFAIGLAFFGVRRHRKNTSRSKTAAQTLA